MLKSEAIEVLGGSVAEAARQVGVSYQAVDKWPEVLPARIVDRVQAALWRKAHARHGSSALAAESEGLTGVGRGLGASSAGHALQSVTAEGCAHPQSSGGGDISAAAGGDGRLAA